MSTFRFPAPSGVLEGGPGATLVPIGAQPTNLGTPWSGLGGAAGGLFKNLETFPGQILFTPSLLSAKQENKLARRDAVRAARNAERTSEHIRGGLDTKTDMVIGATLRVHPEPDWDLLGLNDDEDGWKTRKPFAQACAREFNNWAYDARLLQDAEGHHTFGGLMWMAFRNLIGPDAECAGIIHYDEQRQARYNARWATFVQIVDPDRIETPADHSADPDVFEGKKLDEHGRMVGFWLSKKHPSEGLSTADDYGHVFVPRETAWGRPIGFHWYTKTRAGQMRGVTTLTTILRATGQVDTLDDSMIGAAILSQVLSQYVKTFASPGTIAEQLAPAGGDGGVTFGEKVDYYDKAKIRIGGQRLPVMPPGDEIILEAVNREVKDPTQFRNNFLRMFASSLGLSFEQLSKNFSDANYSAARAALLETWRGVMTQRRLFTAHVASLIYGAVIEEAIAAGRIQLPPGAPPFQENRAAYTACTWTGPGMGWIDPLKEANAVEKMLKLKIKSRAEVKSEMDGGSYIDTFDQIEQENMEAAERGFTLDPLPPGSPGAETNPDPNADPDDDEEPPVAGVAADALS